MSRAFSELDAETAYRLWKLRADVFVVEQNCPYPDLDGRDPDPGTRHVYAVDISGEAADAAPVGYLRVLEEPDGSARVGRVCVAPSHRSAGVARSLMEHAIEHIGARVSVLDAQTYLQEWYERFGYVVTGPEFLDDGIPHVPMRRPG